MVSGLGEKFFGTIRGTRNGSNCTKFVFDLFPRSFLTLFLKNHICFQTGISGVQLTTQPIKNLRTFDIGQYIGRRVDDAIRKNLLLNPWVPPVNFVSLFSVHKKKNKEEKRYASHNHLNQFPWLVFSKEREGYFCKYCPFFVTNAVGGFQKNVELKMLVTQPLKSFAKLFGKDGYLSRHDQKNYHKEAIYKAKEFLRILSNPKNSD